MESIKAVDVKCDKTTKFSVSNWTSYTNAKAKLANVGEWNHVLAVQWVDFTNDDICCFIVILIMDGLNPSLQISRKFWSQKQYTTQSNHFIHHNCRRYAARRFQMFHHFFGVEDPLTVAPPQEQCPNYKTKEFFNWLRHIWKEAWNFGPTVSANDQICLMQEK